jgi:uncharacterized phage protein (TIGR01671 family)
MREIKFRAWDKEMKEWVETTMGYRPQLTKTDQICSVACVFNGQGNCEIMQFTGLLDKNGKEIYEGDVLKSAGIVTWNQEEVRWSCIDIEWNNRREWHDMLYLTTPLETIGNIYEHPNLLTEPTRS